jgi:hypothetical protein
MHQDLSNCQVAIAHIWLIGICENKWIATCYQEHMEITLIY